MQRHHRHRRRRRRRRRHRHRHRHHHHHHHHHHLTVVCPMQREVTERKRLDLEPSYAISLSTEC